MTTNPYAAPQTGNERPTNIIDRKQRDDLAALVRRFLDEDLTAFEFDDLLDDYRDAPDSAVRFVTDAVWYHYDDCDDHLVALSKPEWDYFQRLLLLLESDRCVETTSSRRWSLLQLLAFVALLGFVWVAFRLGWGHHLLLAAVPFGIVSIGISWLRRRNTYVGPYDPIIYPFATFTDLKSAYEAATFNKAQYPRHVQARKIRSPILNAFFHVQFYVTWLVLSPIALAFQMLPRMEMQTRVTRT